MLVRGVMHDAGNSHGRPHRSADETPDNCCDRVALRDRRSELPRNVEITSFASSPAVAGGPVRNRLHAAGSVSLVRRRAQRGKPTAGSWFWGSAVKSSRLKDKGEADEILSL